MICCDTSNKFLAINIKYHLIIYILRAILINLKKAAYLRWTTSQSSREKAVGQSFYLRIL